MLTCLHMVSKAFRRWVVFLVAGAELWIPPSSGRCSTLDVCCCVFFDLHCQGCVKWWQRANGVAAVGHPESVIFRGKGSITFGADPLWVECHFVWQVQYFGPSTLDTLHSTLYCTLHFTLHSLLHSTTLCYTLLHTTTFYYVPLRSTTLCYPLLRPTTLHYTLLHIDRQIDRPIKR